MGLLEFGKPIPSELHKQDNGFKPLPPSAAWRALETILDEGWIRDEGYTTVYESIIERRYPGIWIHLLCNAYNEAIEEHDPDTETFRRVVIEKYLDFGYGPEE